jgi:DNA gyrase subunit A
MVANVETLVTVSNRGYVKRLPPDTYRAQRRGGRGIRGMVLRDEDAPRHMVIANAHDNILFFTDRGRVFQLKAHQIPEADRTAKGTPIINLMNIDTRESITAVIGTASFGGDHYLAMATKLGEIKKVAIDEFSSVRSSGLIAMDLEEGDELGWVVNLSRGAELIFVTEHGQGARFAESTVPARSRAAGGVRSMRLAAGDRVCAMDVVTPNGQLLLVTAGGHAKRTPLSQFPATNRGVGGVIAQKINEKSGSIATARVVRGDEEVMVISAMGTVLRTPVSSVSVQGRAAQGVAFMNLRTGDRIACVALLNGHDQDDNGGSPDSPDAPRRGRRGARSAIAGGGKATTRGGRGAGQAPAGQNGNAGGESTPQGRRPRSPRT